MLDWVCERGLRTWSSRWTESTGLEQNSRWLNVCTKQTTSDCYSIILWWIFFSCFLHCSAVPRRQRRRPLSGESQRLYLALHFFSSSLYFSIIFFGLVFISNCVCPETQVLDPAGRPDGQDLPRTETQPGRRRVGQRRWRWRFQLIFFSSLKNNK